MTLTTITTHLFIFFTLKANFLQMQLFIGPMNLSNGFFNLSQTQKVIYPHLNSININFLKKK